MLSRPSKLFWKHSDDLFNSRSQLEVTGHQTGPETLRVELVFDDASWDQAYSFSSPLSCGKVQFPSRTPGKTEVVPWLPKLIAPAAPLFWKMINKSKRTKQHFHRHSPPSLNVHLINHTIVCLKGEPCKCHIHSGPRRGASKCSKEF